MQPYQYLQQVSVDFDLINTREEIDSVLDEIEFIFDMLDPEFQNLAADLISRLKNKLDEVK